MKKMGITKFYTRHVQQIAANRIGYLTLVEVVMLALLLSQVWFPMGLQAEFASDESHWIHTSAYFEALKVPFSKLWSESYWTLTQPPVTRYIIAVGRLVAGYHPDDLNPPWNHAESVEENIQAGRVPAANLLKASRLPMILLSVAAGLILFLLIRAGFGRLSGYVFLLLYSSPYVITQLSRAMSEAPLWFFFVLSMLCAVKFMKASTSRAQYGWIILMGITVGLAGGSKINGLLTLVSSSVLCLVVAVRADGRQWMRFAVRGVSLLACTTLFFFILPNPFLYANPPWQIGRMIKFRGQEISYQMRDYGEARVDQQGGYRVVVLNEVFQKYQAKAFPGSGWVYGGLFLLGFWMMGWKAWRADDWDTRPYALVLWLLPLPLVVVMAMTPLMWDRYYLFPVLYVTVACSVSVSMLAHRLLQPVSDRSLNAQA